MIIYRKMQITGENHPCHGLWYARPVINETLDIVALAKHNVKLDDLAIFSVGIVSDHGAASAQEFKVSEHVKGLKLRARATGELSNEQINLAGQLREATAYNVETASTTTPGGEDNDDSGQGTFG